VAFDNERCAKRLEGQAYDLPAALAPEKFIEIVPEKKTNFPRVSTNLKFSKLLQPNHLAQKWGFARNNMET
jgi:hypothetical protein